MSSNELRPSGKGYSLSLPQYELIVSYLNTRVKPAIEQLRDADLLLNLNGAPGKTNYFRFNSIVKRMTIRQKDGALLYRANMKVVLPSSSFVEVIRKTHENDGLKHMTMTRTLAKLSEEYTMGSRQFGISEDLVRKVVRNCQECKKDCQMAFDDQVNVFRNLVNKTPVKKNSLSTNGKEETIQPVLSPDGHLFTAESTLNTKATPNTKVKPSKIVPKANSLIPLSVVKAVQDGTYTLIPLVSSNNQGPSASNSLTNLSADNLQQPVIGRNPSGGTSGLSGESMKSMHLDVRKKVAKKSTQNQRILPKLPTSSSNSLPLGNGPQLLFVPYNLVSGVTPSTIEIGLHKNLPSIFPATSTGLDANNVLASNQLILSETKDHIIVNNLQETSLSSAVTADILSAYPIKPDKAGIVNPASNVSNQASTSIGTAAGKSNISVTNNFLKCIGANTTPLSPQFCSQLSNALSPVRENNTSIHEMSDKGALSCTIQQSTSPEMICEPATANDKSTNEGPMEIDVDTVSCHDNEDVNIVEPLQQTSRTSLLKLLPKLEDVPLNYSHLWHNRKELEKEMVPFQRLTGCIRDLRFDVLNASAGDVYSMDVLKKKIHVLEMMIQGQKRYTAIAGGGSGMFGM